METVRHFLIGLAVVLLLGLVAFYVEFIATRGKTPAIPGDMSVASLEEIELGGVPQWILVRAHDVHKPVVLFLHGGPGMPAMYLAHDFQRDMERDFVIVHWDRRGAGKSFESAVDLSVSRTLADTLELAGILRRRFGQDQVYLVGHSWGSYLGLLAVRERPEFFRAFIGTGVMAGSREEVRAERSAFAARRHAEDPTRELTESDLFALGGELYGETSFWPILRTGLFAPEYTFDDALNVGNGADLVARQMKYDVAPKPYEGEIPLVEVPVYFLLGRHDYNTPSALAAAYLERLKSPAKGVIWFEESAHFPFWEEPGKFHDSLLLIDSAIP